MKYTEWQTLTETFGALPLGLSSRHVVGGPVGAHLQEAPLDLADEEDEDEEDEEEEEGDEDLLGDEPEGPEKGFPPDDSEDMDGLPTPDEEMIGGDEMGDEMGDTLAGIDPDLAGLGGEEDPMGGEMPMGDEMGEEMPMGDEMGEEMPMDDMGMGDEMGEEMPMDDMGMGDEMGEEMPMDDMGMGDEMAAAEIPCPDCNMEGEMEEGDPDCETCGGEGFVTDDQAEMPEDPGAVDAELAEDDPEGEMVDLMARMQDYCKRYMPQYSKKFMDKDCDDKKPEKCGKFMSKSCCEENHFLDTLTNSVKSTKHYSGLKEDALLPPEESQQDEPEAGGVGFAPQGRIGAIGGGYTMSDFEEIPTLGESANYTTWQQFRAKKD